MRSNHLVALRVAGACVAVLCISMPGGSARAQGAATLKVMDWNIHHGVDTSGINNLDRVATWIAQVGPDVVSLNEVEKQNGYNNNADEVAVLQSLLQAKTGRAWYSCFAQRTGAVRGQGNLVLSRIVIESCETYLLSASRSVAKAKITVGGVGVSAFSTHLDDASAATRTTQVNQLTSWASRAPEQRVIMGDFNAGASSAELQPLRAAYDDTWAVARSNGTAIAYPGNEAGNTRNTRIDYIWRSKGATHLLLQSVQVFNTGSISDHRPLAAIFSISTSQTSPPLPPRNVRIIGY